MESVNQVEQSGAASSKHASWLAGIAVFVIAAAAVIFYLWSGNQAGGPTGSVAPAYRQAASVAQNGAVVGGYGWSAEENEASAAAEAVTRMRSQLGGKNPKWTMVFSTADYNADQLAEEIQKQIGPNVKMSGITSWKGVMSADGWHAGRSVAVLGIASDKVGFGVGTSAAAEGKGREAAKLAVEQAVANAGKTKKDMPKIVLMNSVLGQEEDMLKGVADVLGKDTPVMGASAGDNDISGKWKEYANGRAYSGNVVVTVIYTNLKVGYMFSSGLGYLQTDKQGVVTKAKGRTIYEIDNRPAADVYNEWLGGTLTSQLKLDEKQINILQQGIIDPLAVVVRGEKGITYYLTVHPVGINLPEKSLSSLAVVEEGKSISIMKGSPEAHELRPPLVIRMARAVGEIKEDEVAAGVAMFCACTQMVLGDQGVSRVIPGMSHAFGNAPFIGAFTFGEEGPVPGIGNRHQNLIQNILIFGKN